MSRLQLSLWLSALSAAVAGTIVLERTSGRSDTGPMLALGLAAATSFVISGLVARGRRPSNLTGLLLIETGFLWFVGALAESTNEWLFPLGAAYGALAFGPFTQLILSFPSGELRLRRHRALVGAVWAVVIGVMTLMLLLTPRLDTTCDDCPENPYAVISGDAAGDAVNVAGSVLAVLLVAWLLTEVVVRYRAASPPLRRTLAPVLAMGGVTVTLLAIANAVDVGRPRAGDVLSAAFLAAFSLVPFAFLAGVLKSRLARSSVAEMLAAIGSGRALRDVIADTVGDPTLQIGYWLPARGQYVDAEGAPVAAEAAAAGTAVQLDGRPIAVLLHDPALADERELLRGIAAAAALSLETERLQADLRDQLALLVTIADTAPSLLVSIAPDGRIVNQNRAAVAAAGLADEEEMRGRFFWDVFIDEWEREAMRERFFAAAPAFPPAAYENAFTNARGELRVIAWESAPLHDDTGTTIGIVGGGLDITERKARETELQRQRDFATTVFGTIPSLLVVLDTEGRIVPDGVNRAFVDLLGRTCEEAEGRRFRDLVAEGARHEAELAVERAAAGVVEPEHESCWLAHDGSEHLIAWTAKPVLDPEGRARVLVSGADVTERHRQDEELRASRTRIVQAADDARRRLERNLHDGAQQRLVSLALSLRLAETRALTDPEEAAAMLAAAREELSVALDELRELARGIHPAILTDCGLGPALEAVAARAPVPVALDVLEGRLPGPIEAAVYFVVAEGLTNVARYAEASSAHVTVTERDGTVVAEVADDGCGGAAPGGGSGIRGLRDRVAALDGALSLESPVGAGTTLRAEIPLPGAGRRRPGRLRESVG